MRVTSLVLVALLGLVACDRNQLGRHRAAEVGDLSLGPPPRAAFDRELVSACGPGELTPRGDELIDRAPYLQRPGPHGVWVLWTTASAGATVEVTTPAGQVLGTIDAGEDASATLLDGTQWVARLDGLEPATIYCYQLHDLAGAPLTARTGFRTAPRPGDAATVRFVDLGDVGTSSIDQHAVRRQLETVEHDFILINGDVAYPRGTLRQLERHVFGVYARLMRSVPMFVASGNHDYQTRDAQPLREVFALPDNGGPHGVERWYSYDWGSVHVVVLDTERIGAIQAAWLDADLRANRLPWTVVVLHRPPYAAGVHGDDRNVQAQFVPLFEEHGVDLVLAGHEHHYERLVPINGVQYVISGAGGRGVRKVRPNQRTAFAQAVAHFVYVVVTPTELSLWAIDASGAAFDSLTLVADAI